MRGSRHDREGRQGPALPVVRALVWLTVPVALIAELGHRAFPRLTHSFGGHLFHVLPVFLAGSIFFAWVVVDVRRHGWPGFSWRGRPRA